MAVNVLISDKNNRYLTRILLRMINVADKVVRKKSKHTFYFQKDFF